MFRFQRITALALLASLWSMTLFAQSSAAPSSKQRKFAHKLKITSKYNKATDTSGVQFFLKQPNSLARLAGGGTSAGAAFGEDVGISLFFSHPGRQVSAPVEEAVLWVAYTGGPRTAVTDQLSAIVDGREVVLSRQVDPQESPGRGKANQVASISLTVTRNQLSQLANASKVVLVLSSSEQIILDQEQLNALADFISRMSP